MLSQYHHLHLCVRQPAPDQGVQVTLVRFDPNSRHMVFESVADLLGDLSDPRDAADLLAHGAEIYRLRVHSELPHP